MLLRIWDNGFETRNRPQNKEHPIAATTPPPRPHPYRLRRSPPGGQCRADPSGHPRPGLGLPQLVQQCLDLGNAPGRANTGDKMMTLVASAPLAATVLTTPMCCAPGGQPAPGRHGQGALHPGHLPAQFPVGPCPPTGPGEPELLAQAWAAGAGPSDAPFTIDLDSTICEGPTDWPRRAPATTAIPASGAITRCWPLPPEPATCDGPAA